MNAVHLTTYTDYSIRVLVRLSLRPTELTTIAEIARAYDISEHHLMKVVHQLGKAGYVETLRGRGGGMRLARPAAKINVGEVVRRMEPGFALVGCFEDRKSCPIETACGFSRAVQRALDAFLRELDRHTLADLVDQPRRLATLLGLGKAGASTTRATRRTGARRAPPRAARSTPRRNGIAAAR